jgi:hypothetical protein
VPRFGHGVREAHETALGRPEMTGWKGLDEVLPLGIEGAHLRGEAHAPVLPCPVERLDPDRVTRGDEVAVLAGGQEGVHAVQLAEGVGTALLEQMQGDLVVGTRAKGVGYEVGTDLLVVVDLAVADEPQVARVVAQRLVAAGDVDDREPGLAQPAVADADLPLVVGPTVGEPVSHTPPRLGVGITVGGAYSTHR